MKTVDGIILGVVMLIVAVAAFFAVRRKKRGSCCVDCAGCSEKGHCEEPQKKADK
ncbi:MAG: FeoB-associated Cys-rich membrane protein [Clostridia bacterium]|nr:FeoB-associated Cys-rich membrane protein [Clostridia bacterium]